MTSSVLEVEVKVPAATVNGPLTVTKSFPPEKVPPCWSNPVLPTVTVLPEFWVIVPVYPELMVIPATSKLLLIAALSSQSASKIIVSAEVGLELFPVPHAVGSVEDQLLS